MEEWKEYKLGEVCNMIPGFAFKSKDFGSGKDIAIKIKDICPPYVETKEADNVEISNYNPEKLLKFVVRKGEFLLAMTGATIGKIGRYICEEPAYVNQRVLKFEDAGLISYDYLYYYLSTNVFRSFILNHIDSQSAQPNISSTTIGKYPIKAPNIKEQNRIASILKSLDDKIEVNRKINENLEQQAQALFKSWFVDFEPFKGGEFVESELGMIPNGWNVGKLEDILELRRDNIRKEDKWDYPYLPIDIIPMHSLGIYDFKSNDEAQSSLQLFEKNDIVIGAMRVYFHRVVIAPQKGITRNTCFVLRPKNDNSLAFSVLLCNTEDAISFASRTSKGSTMPYSVWEGGFNTYKFPCPPNNVIADFDKLCKPYLERIRDAYKENVRLASLRDTLLPRLMSGELKVNEIENAI